MHIASILPALEQDGKLTAEQAAEFHRAESDGQDAAALLITRGICTDRELRERLATALGLPLLSTGDRVISTNVLALLPRNLAERYHAIALEREGDLVTIGLVDPTDPTTVEALEFFLRDAQVRVRFAIITLEDFRNAIPQYADGAQDAAAAISAAAERLTTASGTTTPEETDLTSAIEKAPISKIVSTMIHHAVAAHASDIHIEPFGKETRVRFRVDGVLRTMLALPIGLHAAIVARIKVLARLKLDETRIPQDGRMHLAEHGREIDFRVSTLPLLDHEKVVLRILDTSAEIVTLADLGFRADQIAVIDRSVHRPHGMVLLSGPTGSGKSTTLYAVLSLLNAEGMNITTLEDPVEYYVRGVNQAQIRPEVEFTFAAGLRAILRQDPNVIMVGEIRDTETAELAIHAGLTGHLLFSTLHTRDVFGVVPRLVDMKIEPFLLASTLITAVAQRLIRRICPDCREEFTPSTDITAAIRASLGRFPENAQSAALRERLVTLSRGRGCGTCGGSGYRGRTVVAELLEFDAELQQLIVQGFPEERARALAFTKGMTTLHQDALGKALEGETTYEEVLRISHE